MHIVFMIQKLDTLKVKKLKNYIVILRNLRLD
jgi:hypothetical protein